MKSFKTKQGTDLPLLNLRGKDYLQVAHRLVWFREERPTWGIETEFVERTAELTVVKATIKDESGRIIATAHKQECKKDFGDHQEKAETSAIGRALALCGYGTQFAEELDEADRPADSPTVAKKAVQVVTKEDAEAIAALMKQNGISKEQLTAHIKIHHGQDRVGALSLDQFKETMNWITGDKKQ